MEFKAELKEDRIIVYLDGEIDLDKTDAARESIIGSLEKSNKIFVNLNAVKYIDSSGVSVLIEAHQKANEMEKEFEFVSKKLGKISYSKIKSRR